MALEFTDFSAAQAGNVDVVAWAVGLVVVAIAAKMEQVQFIDKPLLLEEIDGSVDGDEVDVGTDFLRAIEDLIDVKMLLSVVHNLEDYAALAGQTNATLTKGVLEMARWVRGVDAFAGRDSVCG